MERKFSSILSELRRLHRVSQRKAAADLQISQALLSHYENGAREPGLAFVCRACDYYGVSADYILGRVEDDGKEARRIEMLRGLLSELRGIAEKADRALGD